MIPQQPDTILSPLGYSSDTRNIPATTPAGTNQLSFESGFPPLTSTPLQSGGVPPERQDFNAAFKLLSEFIYYLQSGNQFVWSNLLDYDKGCTILGSDGALYLCIQANGATSPNTVQDPTSSTDYWIKVIDSRGILNINVIGDGTITGAKIANATITGAKLANDTITAAQISENAITASELANNAVDSAAIATNAVTNAKIANDAVNNAKISDVAASKVTGLARVATSGSYNDLTNKPTIPTNVAPLPVPYKSNYSVGIWLSVQPAQNYTLPAGGTWAWFGISVSKNLIYATVSAGGTVIGVGNSEPNSRFLVWRIQ